MAFFQILREVRLGKPADWQICFQFGIYHYDPEPAGENDPEAGYRFIWRRPNGQLQGARGQARLTPEYITGLLGMASQAGWYPTPPEVQDRLPSVDLLEASEAVLWASKAYLALLRAAMGPVASATTADRLKALSGELKAAAGLEPNARGRHLKAFITPDHLDALDRWEATASAPGVEPDIQERLARERFLELIRPLTAYLRLAAAAA